MSMQDSFSRRLLFNIISLLIMKWNILSWKVIGALAAIACGGFMGGEASAVPVYIPNARLVASDGQPALEGENRGDYFGYGLAIQGDTALVGAYYDDDNNLKNSGSVYVFTKSNGYWVETQKLHSSVPVEGGTFGYRVAMDGSKAVSGEYSAGGMGQFSFLKESGGTWSNDGDPMRGSDTASGDRFGYDVDILGNTAIAGAPLDDDNGDNSGSAYIFTYDGTSWTQQAKLLAGDGAAGRNFGYSLRLAGEDLCMVGSPYVGAGAAYIYQRSGSTWTESAKLLANDGSSNDCFGLDVDVVGNTAIVGAYKDDDKGSNSGAAYVFTYDGTSWTQQAKLLASDGAAGDGLGFSVKLIGEDANRAVVGAYYEDSGLGAAYLYERSGTTWTEIAKWIPSDLTNYFGSDIASDGDTVLVGAPLGGAGLAYTFYTDGSYPPTSGDTDLDGDVDADDAAAMAANWLKSTGRVTWSMGDFNFDGVVDDKDATLLAANWSETKTSASVPEPGVLAMLLGLMVLGFAGAASKYFTHKQLV